MAFFLANLRKNIVFVIIFAMTKEERAEKRAKIKEIREQNRDFIERLKPLIAKKYRTSMRFEDSLMDHNLIQI